MTLPLAGIKVLDFSEHGFVPSAAAALGDFGADVVKVERLQGDAGRGIIASGMVATKDGYDYLFELFNRNKRGLGLDVWSPAGREVFERAVKWADVYITNQLPRVRRKLRTEPADLLAHKPRLVYAKGHGQGQQGAGAEQGGFDGVSYWARGGVAAVLTDPAFPSLVQQRPGLGDIPSGMFLAGGICAGLVHALRTGKGVVVDTSLLGGAAWTLGPDLAYSSLTGEQLPTRPEAERSPLTRPYKTADGRWVSLMMIDEARYWAQACRALGLDELVDAYPDAAARRDGKDEIYASINAVITASTRAQVAERLTAQDCIYSFVATPVEVLDDEAVSDNGYLMQHPRDDVRIAAAPVQFDDEQLTVRRPGPGLGEHSREVLGELGYSADEIAALERDAVVTATGG
jgi:crotonobetainyl-CoA:carnitine CoA-transferase CaiB-like acyl-CoA transferase